MTKHEFLMLNVSQLKVHPENVRRRYVESEVEEMAASIDAQKGGRQN